MSYNILNVTRGILIGRQMFASLKALDFAAKAHEGQTRKGSSIPYIDHPVMVATILLNAGVYDEDIISAAFLHDVLEDTYADELELLNNGIPKSTIEIVKLLTKVKGYDEDKYYKEISKDPKAAIVKCADRAHNLSTMGQCWDRAKILSYIEEANEYIYPLLRKVRWEMPQYAAACMNMKLIIDAVENLALALEREN